jgi:hypothetical protein
VDEGHLSYFVIEHMRRRIDFYMQRPPQGDPHRCVVWHHQLLTIHDVLALGFRLFRNAESVR